MEKHQWIVEVIEDLTRYALLNKLDHTFDALNNINPQALLKYDHFNMHRIGRNRQSSNIVDIRHYRK